MAITSNTSTVGAGRFLFYILSHLSANGSSIDSVRVPRKKMRRIVGNALLIDFLRFADGEKMDGNEPGGR
ncbi:hypothetical protein ZHAS_00008955 [Anopheles sinensis]|uniref:Uncharacterized protein n=1 Tax=Anopheles sinensis TaxID=74873 RepID=A0A084VTT0_ANOSI|nr:hypothetical protein ZHAS_00008955 [Anopheles sinensis]